MPPFPQAIGLSPVHLLVVGLVLSVILVVAKRRFFSSISEIPGPKWAPYSVLWKCWHTIKGHEEKEILAYHRKYGK